LANFASVFVPVLARSRFFSAYLWAWSYFYCPTNGAFLDTMGFESCHI